MRLNVRVPGTSRRSDRTIRIQVIEGHALAAVCVVTAATISLTTELGSHADLSYYATVAQVIPVFLLALMVDVRSRLGQHFNDARTAIEAREAELRTLLHLVQHVGNEAPEEDFESARGRLRDVEQVIAENRAGFDQTAPKLRRVLRGFVIVATPGELASLTALAAGAGNTFALSLAALSLVAMTLLWLRSFTAQFESARL